MTQQEEVERLQRRIAELELQVAQLQQRDEHLRLFETLIEHSVDGVTLTDLQYRLLYVNPAILKLHGSHHLADLQGKDIDTLFAPEEHQRLHHEILPQVLQHGSWQGRLWTHCTNGSRCFVYISAFLIRDAQGNPLAYASFLHDTTTEHTLETALHQNEALLQAVIDHSPALVFVKDAQGNYLLVNQRFATLCNTTPEAMIGANEYDLFTPEMIETWKESDILLFTEGRTDRSELSGMLEGRLVTYQTITFPLSNAQGEIYAMAGISTDITEAKEAEALLRQSQSELELRVQERTTELTQANQALRAEIEERKQIEANLQHNQSLLNAFLEHSPAAVFLKNLERRYLLVNRHYAQNMGFSPETMIGKTEDELFPATFEAWKQVDQVIVQSGKPARVDGFALHPDGLHSYIVLKFPIYDAEGHISGIGAVATDITERKRAEERIRQQFQRLSALRQIDLAINASLDLRLILNVLLDHVTSQLQVDAALVMLLDTNTHILHHAASRGIRSSAIQHLTVQPGEGLAGHVALQRRPISMPRISASTIPCRRLDVLHDEAFISYYGIPLVAKGQLKGVLEIFHRAPLDPDEEWQEFLETLAGQAAIAITNMDLLTTLQRSQNELVLAYDATIDGLARALELRDAETEGHSRRVTDMTLKLARAMQVPENQLAHIRRGAVLHDIGKIAIPDSILLKPGALTEEEWAIMRQHPVYAYQWLVPITYLHPALDIPYYHHERWDGTGYPAGLQGEHIPLAARIFAVVDVWDALSTDRPYRHGLPSEQVYHYLREQASHHFDPEIVATFLEILHQDQP